MVRAARGVERTQPVQRMRIAEQHDRRGRLGVAEDAALQRPAAGAVRLVPVVVRVQQGRLEIGRNVGGGREVTLTGGG